MAEQSRRHGSIDSEGACRVGAPSCIAALRGETRPLPKKRTPDQGEDTSTRMGNTAGDWHGL